MQYFCRFHKVAMHGSRPPLAPPVPRGEDRLPPCERGGLRGERVANRGCFVKSAKLLLMVVPNFAIDKATKKVYTTPR